MRERLLVLILAAVALAACDRSGAPEGGTGELHALVDSMLPSLARLAALEPLEPVRLERRDTAQVRAYVEGQLAEELPPDQLDALQRVYALLGLVPDTLDLRSLLLRLYTEQIVGYYDPAEKTLYVVEGVAPAAVAPVLAHELVHALQDQHANLDSLIARERGNDRRSAAHAALEGHATLVMFAWLAEQAEGRRLDPATLPNPALSLREGLRAQNEQYPVFRQAPFVLRETLLFPYFAGADFVHRLWQAQRSPRPAPLGRWLPHSTEQVLHPEQRFLQRRDAPVDVVLGEQPGEWVAVGQDDTFGELETGLFLASHLGEPARSAARGWAGDRFRLLRSPDGAHALAWYTAWDDSARATAFADAVARVAERVPGLGLTAERLSGQRLPMVRVLAAPGAVPPASALPGWCLGGGTECSIPGANAH